MNKKGFIPENLTFDEFKKFAEREPVLNENWYYKVVQIFSDPSMKVPYPMFDLDCPEKRIFALQIVIDDLNFNRKKFHILFIHIDN